MVRGAGGYPCPMSENTEYPTGAQGDPADTRDATDETTAGGYDAGTDTDADPEVMNPRDLTGEASGETDPDSDPDSTNPRGEA